MTDLELANVVAVHLYGDGATVEVEQDEESGWARADVRHPNGSLVPDTREHHRTPDIAVARVLYNLASTHYHETRTRDRAVQAA